MKIFRLAALFVFTAVFSGCSGDDTPNPGDSKAHNRVYYIYMAADNSLGYQGYDDDNIAMLTAGATYSNIGNGRIYVFQDPYIGSCRMLEIKADADGNGKMTVLRSDYGDYDTTDPATFEMALNDMVAYATADGRNVSSYILDLWSHGSGWVLNGRAVRSEGSVHTRAGIAPSSVVNDGLSYMQLEAFVDLIEPGFFDAVIFAQCYSAGIEMAYLMRDKTDYMVGCATEMLAMGFPYHTVLPHLFETKPNYARICDRFYDYYQAMSVDPTVTIAYFDLKAFNNDFVETMGGIFTEKHEAMGALGTGDVQYYDYHSSSPRKYFDLGDLIDVVYEGEGSATLYNDFWLGYNKIVPYKRITDRLFGREIDKDKFSGMTTHIMFNLSEYSTVNVHYQTTAWYEDVVAPAISGM